MKILFMGTPEFAVSSLKALVNAKHEIVGVFTQPDKPKNRGHKLTFSPLKECALSLDLPVFQPENLTDGEAVRLLNELKPELIVVAAFGQILPKEVLSFPKYGCINVHSSILPKYRGAAPINFAILNGDENTGVSIMYMAEELDAGDILSIIETPIDPDENALELTNRLAELGAKRLVEVISKLESNEITAVKQDESQVTFTTYLDKSMSHIDFSKSAKEIHNQVRGLIPWPCACTEIDGKLLKVYKTHLGSSTNQQPGSIVNASKQGIEIACGDKKTIVLDEIQAEGGKRMDVASYLAGHPITIS